MAPLLEHPAQRLVALLDAGAPRLLIGMVGLPGAGKTTLAAQLAAAVDACTASGTAVALGMDGFHLTQAQLRMLPDPAAAFARRGAPWTFDPQAFQARLDMVRAAAGRAAVPWPGFEHAVGDPVAAATTVAAATRLVIVEGLYLLHRADGWEAVSRRFDERWYLDTPLETALERLALRHMQAWGISRDEAERRIARNDRLNAAIVQTTAQFADWWLASF